MPSAPELAKRPPEPRLGWTRELLVRLQYPLPHHPLSRLARWLANRETRLLKDLAIRLFIRAFQVEVAEAVERDPSAYSSFNAFFTRALRPDARPIDPAPDALLSPVDGTLSEYGTIHQGLLLQAKGHEFALTDLLAGDQQMATRLAEGAFATLYLSPGDYHRVHMPLAGMLHTMRHVPGRLFSVNSAASRLVPRLYCRNERLICSFETRVGPMVLVLVGAFFVGDIETVWSPKIATARGGAVRQWAYGAPGPTVRLERGEEMGRFNMGSTVILLLPAGVVSWAPQILAGARLRMGQAIGHLP